MTTPVTYPPHYPEEYQVGEVTFWWNKFQVTPDVLIPRLETECLVRKAFQLAQQQSFVGILDVGCGSGIIGLSCAKELSNLPVCLTDISNAAVELARSNAQKNSILNVSFAQGDLLSGAESFLHNFGNQGDLLILANLPYIGTHEKSHMSPDTVYEPAEALFGGPRGDEMYLRFFEQLVQKHTEYKTHTWHCLIEFGWQQAELFQPVFEAYDWTFDFFEDYSGIRRFAYFRV